MHEQIKQMQIFENELCNN